MNNLLKNADFEGGWHRKTCRGEFGGIFVPDEWNVCWKEGLPVEHDPSNPNGYGLPEIHVINKEPPFLDPARIQNGFKAIKAFTFYRIHDIVFSQQAIAIVGELYRASAWAHAWSSNGDDPKKSDIVKPNGDIENFTFTVGIDPTGGTDAWADTVVWGDGAHIYNKYAPVPAVEVKAKAQTITYFVRSNVLWPFKHCDAYIDNVTLEHIPVEPPPGNGECIGKPRIQYAAVRWLMPDKATQENREEALELIGTTLGTLCYSADDACQGSLLLRHVMILWFKEDSFNLLEIENFITTYYPGVTWEHVILYTEQPPVVNPPGAPDPIIHYTNNLIGCQHQRTQLYWDTYLTDAKPNLVKMFTCGDVIQARLNNPEALVIWRKHQTRGEQGELMTGDLKANALKLLDKYTNELEAYAKNNGMTVEQILYMMKKKWAIESLNEEVPSFNVQQLQKAQEFDIWVSYWVHKRYGDKLNAGLMTIAVGNPHETEFELLLPVAKVCHETGDYFSYHNYWTANRDKTYLVDRWINFAGRALEMDKVFVEHGYYVKHYGGETSSLYSPDGWALNANLAWKSCGDFPYYLDQIELLNQRLLDWNLHNQGRYYGVALFVYGNYGWLDFAWNPGDMQLLIERMRPYGNS